MKEKMMRIRPTVAAVAVMFVAFAAFAEEASVKEAKPATAASTEDAGKYKPLAEARAKIGDVISDPKIMTDIMKELSPADQKTFLADVNAAISKLPGSTEDKTAKYLNVNRAALRGVPTTALVDVLAVTFATVPPESLTVISERYAVDLFSRDVDASHSVTDAAYEKMATEVVGRIEKETSGSDYAGVRNTLAILMFVKADGGKIEDLTDKLVETIPDATARALAKKEWIPAAMSKKEAERSYDAMLAYADAGKAPSLDIVLNLAGPQILDAMVVDITSAMDNAMGIQTTPVLDQAFGGYDEPRAYLSNEDTTSASATMNGGGSVPRTTDPDKPWNPGYNRDNVDEKTKEPKPYPYGDM